jgi:hypothetical protein
MTTKIDAITFNATLTEFLINPGEEQSTVENKYIEGNGLRKHQNLENLKRVLTYLEAASSSIKKTLEDYKDND